MLRGLVLIGNGDAGGGGLGAGNGMFGRLAGKVISVVANAKQASVPELEAVVVPMLPGTALAGTTTGKAVSTPVRAPAKVISLGPLLVAAVLLIAEDKLAGITEGTTLTNAELDVDDDVLMLVLSVEGVVGSG